MSDPLEAALQLVVGKDSGVAPSTRTKLIGLLNDAIGKGLEQAEQVEKLKEAFEGERGLKEELENQLENQRAKGEVVKKLLEEELDRTKKELEEAAQKKADVDMAAVDASPSPSSFSHVSLSPAQVAALSALETLGPRVDELLQEQRATKEELRLEKEESRRLREEVRRRLPVKPKKTAQQQKSPTSTSGSTGDTKQPLVPQHPPGAFSTPRDLLPPPLPSQCPRSRSTSTEQQNQHHPVAPVLPPCNSHSSSSSQPAHPIGETPLPGAPLSPVSPQITLASFDKNTGLGLDLDSEQGLNSNSAVPSALEEHLPPPAKKQRLDVQSTQAVVLGSVLLEGGEAKTRTAQMELAREESTGAGEEEDEAAAEKEENQTDLPAATAQTSPLPSQQKQFSSATPLRPSSSVAAGQPLANGRLSTTPTSSPPSPARASLPPTSSFAQPESPPVVPPLPESLFSTAELTGQEDKAKVSEGGNERATCLEEDEESSKGGPRKSRVPESAKGRSALPAPPSTSSAAKDPMEALEEAMQAEKEVGAGSSSSSSSSSGDNKPSPFPSLKHAAPPPGRTPSSASASMSKSTFATAQHPLPDRPSFPLGRNGDRSRSHSPDRLSSQYLITTPHRRAAGVVPFLAPLSHPLLLSHLLPGVPSPPFLATVVSSPTAPSTPMLTITTLLLRQSVAGLVPLFLTATATLPAFSTATVVTTLLLPLPSTPPPASTARAMAPTTATAPATATATAQEEEKVRRRPPRRRR